MRCLSIAFLIIAVAISYPCLVPAEAPAAEATSGDGQYVIHTVAYSTNDYIAIRYHKHTGESWVMQRNAWKKVKETTEVPAGSYQVVLASSGHVDQKSWFGFRVESNSGKSWRIVDHAWTAIEMVAE